MQGADMQEVWFIKLFTVFGKIVAGVLGAILALVLSGDIDKDGRIKINPSLESLCTTNPEMYADVVSQLDGGTVYFYDVAENFMTQLLQILPNPPAVDLDQLRQLWIAQAAHHIEI